MGNKIYYHNPLKINCPYDIYPFPLKIGSATCSNCKFNEIYNEEENYIICKKHTQKLRKEKIKKLFEK